MANDHNVEIDDDPDNWLAWGQLVRDWADGTKVPPTDKQGLQAQWDERGITGKIKGRDGRAVSVQIYDGRDENNTIVIPIPHEDMIQRDHDYLMERWDSAHKRYPTPRFYNLIYQGIPAKRNLTKDEMIEMGLRRLGEYVINECM